MRDEEDRLRVRGIILRLQEWLDGKELDPLIEAPLLDIAQASLDMVVYANKRRVPRPEHVVSDDDPS